MSHLGLIAAEGPELDNSANVSSTIADAVELAREAFASGSPKAKEDASNMLKALAQYSVTTAGTPRRNPRTPPGGSPSGSPATTPTGTSPARPSFS